MGRLSEVKGFDRLITSFSIIRHAVPDAVLTIIGKGVREEKLKALAAGLGLGDAVCFAGFVPDPVPVLRQQNLFALTSYEEGFPNALIEAMSCGCHVLVSDIPVLREVCGDAATYFDPYNPYAIRKAIQRFLTTPGNSVPASYRFSWATSAKTLVSLLKEKFSDRHN